MTPGVQPPPPQMGEIISCCGGTVLPSMPHSYKVWQACPEPKEGSGDDGGKGRRGKVLSQMDVVPHIGSAELGTQRQEEQKF